MAKSDFDIYGVVTERIVAQLEAGTAPWRKPWKASTSGPRNIEGYRYRGINVWLLLSEGYSSPYWMTFKQAKARGGSVKKGEKSTVIVFWKRLKVTDKDTGEDKVIPMLRYYRVFNLEQTEGVKLPKKVTEELAAEPAEPVEVIDAGEAIVHGYADGPRVYRNGTAAFYEPNIDRVTVPGLDSFDDAAEFYSTLFHELGHSTGHQDRLGRTYGKKFGDHEYGREELVAEMTSAFLQAEAGIEHVQANSAAYLANWIRALREDTRAVVVAAGAAQKAADLILGRTWEKSEAEPASSASASSPVTPSPIDPSELAAA
jgi:antirestriction protein ArdC